MWKARKLHRNLSKWKITEKSSRNRLEGKTWLKCTNQAQLRRVRNNQWDKWTFHGFHVDKSKRKVRRAQREFSLIAQAKTKQNIKIMDSNGKWSVCLAIYINFIIASGEFESLLTLPKRPNRDAIHLRFTKIWRWRWFPDGGRFDFISLGLLDVVLLTFSLASIFSPEREKKITSNEANETKVFTKWKAKRRKAVKEEKKECEGDQREKRV